MVNDTANYYKTFKLRKKTGGYRWISVPNEELKLLHRKLNLMIFMRIRPSESVHSFVKKSSIRTNAEVHVNAKTCLNVDLYRFYESITDKRVFGYLCKLGYHPNVSYVIAALVTIQLPKAFWQEVRKENKFRSKYIRRKPKARVLPQGSPCSPFLSNLVLTHLDFRIEQACKGLGFSYSRYADDITISSKGDNFFALTTLKKIIRSEGFTINIQKISFRRSSSRIQVTGITVNNGIFVNKSLYKKVVSHLYYCKKYGVRDHLEKVKLTNKSNYKDWLLGNILFINSVEPDKAKKLFTEFNQIDFLL
ncbi:MAG: RNA-directed DNA polymerase [Proteobacteria bacterium]|nr:MAG: RNA-directed DNA polymerase [Pseudomonadota bacterium]